MIKLILTIYGFFSKKDFILICSDSDRIDTVSNINDDVDFYKLIGETYCTQFDEVIR